MSNNFIRLADRVKEISYTTGTGNLALDGAVAGFSSFRSAYGSTANIFYAVTNGTSYEVGSGVYVSGTQDEIIRFPFRSSNNNNKVNFPEGVKEIYATYPATHSVYTGSGLSNLNTPQTSGIAFWASPNMLDYDSNIIWNKSNHSLGINTNNPQYGLHLGSNGSKSLIKASGLILGNSGIYFPPANNGDINYVGGRQLTHYEKNQLDQYAYDNSLIDQLTGSDSVIELSGVANQYILFKKQNAGTIFAGPASGCTPPCSPGYPSFRPLTSEDIPDLSELYVSSEDLSDLSGILNDKIFASFNLATDTSGILNTKINTVSGILRNDITTSSGITNAVSGILRNDLTIVSGLAIGGNTTALSGVLRNDITTVSGLIPSYSNSYVAEGRLTLESGVAVSTSNQTAKTIVYYTPYNGNNISLYNGSKWDTINFSQVSLTLGTLTSSKNYDIFGYNNNGTLTLELSAAWTNDTTRADAITLQNGVYCKTGSLTRRYLGTIRTTNTTTTEDSLINRFVWNINNKVNRRLYSPSIFGWWSYSTQAWRGMGGSSNETNRIRVVNGLNENIISVTAGVLFTVSPAAGDTLYHLGIGQDTETSAIAKTRILSYNTKESCQLYVNTNSFVGQGFHYYAPLELCAAYTTPYLYGSDTDNFFGGIFGSWEC